MGGHIDYRSVPGAGATFFFDIPVAIDEIEGSGGAPADGLDNAARNGKFVRGLPPVKAPTTQADGSRAVAVAERSPAMEEARLRILLCEDDPDLVQLLSVILADVAEPVFAMTLREARDRLEEERFDLVILDPGLPDGSGLVLLPELNRNDGPPVIIFSALNVDAETARQAASTLVKSRHSHHDLLLAIREVLTTENREDSRTNR
jgi:CheY-like chemotaxis protein